jgi:hypothetical protein
VLLLGITLIIIEEGESRCCNNFPRLSAPLQPLMSEEQSHRKRGCLLGLSPVKGLDQSDCVAFVVNLALGNVCFASRMKIRVRHD